MRPGANRQTVVTERHSIGDHVESFGSQPQISSLRPTAEAQALALDLTPSIGSIRVAGVGDGNRRAVGRNGSANGLVFGPSLTMSP